MKNMPNPLPGETVEQYRKRLLDVLATAKPQRRNRDVERHIADHVFNQHFSKPKRKLRVDRLAKKTIVKTDGTVAVLKKRAAR